jgi:hypothetical protein
VFSCFRGLLPALAIATVACGAPLMKLPQGPGAPAADAADALSQATAECRAVRTLTAEVAASGRADGSRFRGRLLAGVAAPASARIEAVAPFGPPLFILVATGDDATLLLPRDDRVLERGHPREVLDAVAGVPLDAADLFVTLAGCAPGDPPARGNERGSDWRVLEGADGVELYLHRDGTPQPWRLVAMIRRPASGPAWRAEYRDHQGGLPQTIRLSSIATPGGRGFDLTLRLAQVETNVPLEPSVFRVDVPPSASPITLDELRHARPGVRED